MKKIILISLLVIISIVSCETKESSQLFSLKSSDETGISFNNVITETDSFNILTEEYIFNGGGVAIGDFNNDDRSDIFFTGNQVSNRLYLNQGNFKFKDVSEASGITAEEKWSTGAAIIDINADGWLDVYVCAAMHQSENLRKNMLFVNQGLNDEGSPTFREMAEKYGIDDDRNSMNATFFDFNKDGLLDLYVLNNEQNHILPTNYRPKINDGSAASNDRLYRNNGDGTFTDVTIESGIVYEGFGLGIAVADLNYDGWPDIHISNDYITNDVLYINNRDGTFTNQTENYLKHQSKFSMGSDIADYDNDGFLDIITLDMLGETNQRMKTTIGETHYLEYILNERYDYQYQYMRNMLHKGNASGGNFNEIGLMAGISRTDWSWSPLFMDVDNDGFRDLLITNGFPRDITDKDFGDFSLGASPYLSPDKILDSIPVVKISNYAYRNKGDWTFENASAQWGIDIPSFSNGAAFADLDSDGDLDYVVNNINDTAFIFENKSKDNHSTNNRFLRIDLAGPNNNPLGIGTKIKITYGKDSIQYEDHYLTRGYMSSIEPTVHFGVNNNDTIRNIEIEWPDGRYQQLVNVKSDQILQVAYTNSVASNESKLTRSTSLDSTKTYLIDVTEKMGLTFRHKEQDIVDFNLQRTLPHKLTQNGPCLAVGDLNGDSFQDILVGSSSGYSPVILFQDKNGNFEEKIMFENQKNTAYEEEDIELFDIDNDGDLDVYLVSGSNEFERESDYYLDRLLINDGRGKFKLASERIPNIRASGSVVKAGDFDNDGYIDLFVGGRTPMGSYPLAERSFLLKNEKGVLKDVTETIAPDLVNVGMLNDAIWVDYNGDGNRDLIVVGELMPITVFKNNGESFERITNSNIEDYLGWWESIEAADMDHDGDIDFVVGNLGRNNLFQPSPERPVSVVVKDFDKNGSLDPISFAYFANKEGNYSSYPISFWGDINKQSTLFRAKFNFFRDYARATASTLLTDEELENALILRGNFDESSFVENLGDDRFKLHSLPIEAQLAPLNDIQLTDIDGDGIRDILGIGNNFGNEIFVGRYDASNGFLLKGQGNGSFSTIAYTKSGFLTPRDSKSIEQVKCATGGYYYFVSQNKEGLLIFKTQSVQ